jgi:hypothetical protein
MKIYLASSWRNTQQPDVLAALRDLGHKVYDFRNPEPGNTGFAWRQVDAGLVNNPSTHRLRAALANPIAQYGFDNDFNAMKWADVCVLLLPCGLSAHMEAGWMGGAGKHVAILAPEIREPELMYKMFDNEFCETPLFDALDDVKMFLRRIESGQRRIKNGEPGFNEALMRGLASNAVTFAQNDTPCSACGHRHVASMGGICIGCPCEERE